MRLIDADALVAAYDAAHDGPPGKARTLILNAPTVDAVPRAWWEELRETIKELEESDGDDWWRENCKFISRFLGNLMNTIEGQYGGNKCD